MPMQVCPRCQRTNPEYAEFCYYDGANLRMQGGGSGSYNTLLREFVFPSGRRCRTFDELAQGCNDEWSAAKDLLAKGTMQQFFGSISRLDLARAAQEAVALPDRDVGLTTLLGNFPGVQVKAPQLDINPRRLLLGTLLAGEQRRLQLTVTNRGQGVLQGTVTVSEGGNFLKVGQPPALQCTIQAPREQKIDLLVDTRGQPSGQPFGGRLTVVTNGGVIEAPVRFDLVAQPFGKAPFQGARSPREMAEKMRQQPKLAVPLLESGDIARWFAGNGWNYPITGPQIKGVGAVQQFFEVMGLSKPPAVQLTPPEVRLQCQYPEPVRFQAALQTAKQKWVYAQVTSALPWLKVLTPSVSGPRQASISLEVDPKLATGSSMQGQALVTANGGQKLMIRVQVEVKGLPAHHQAPQPIPVQPMAAPLPTAVPWSAGPVSPVVVPYAAAPMPTALPLPTAQPLPAVSSIVPVMATAVSPGLAPARPLPVPVAAAPAGAVRPGVAPMPVQPVPFPAAFPSPGPTRGAPAATSFFATVLAVTLAFFLLRLALIPVVDGFLRSGVVQATATKLNHEPRPDSPVAATGGWLHLKWASILIGAEGQVSGELFEKDATWTLPQRDFRHYYSSYFVRRLALWTWWIGAVIGALVALRRGSITDLPWGIVAGAMAGLAGSATIACLYLVVEIWPHALWSGMIGPSSGAGMVFLWLIVALVGWAMVGAVVGLLLAAVPALKRSVAQPLQQMVGGVFRLCGMRRLGTFFAGG